MVTATMRKGPKVSLLNTAFQPLNCFVSRELFLLQFWFHFGFETNTKKAGGGEGPECIEVDHHQGSPDSDRFLAQESCCCSPLASWKLKLMGPLFLRVSTSAHFT
jgi:hypothetical protein